MLSKKDIRREYLSKRRAFSSEKVRVKSEAIFKNLMNYLQGLKNFQNGQIKDFYVYHPINNEVDILSGFLKLADESFSGKEIFLPVTLNEKDMLFRRFDTHKKLEVGRYGIPEPDDTCSMGRPDEKSVLILPCVAVSQSGHRIGYGAGYYDRYLAQMCRNLSKNLMICVSFDEFVIPQVVHDDWDYKVKVIITDKRISIN